MITPNERQATVLHLVEEGESVSVSGPARSGKTALAYLLWSVFERAVLLTADRAEAERTGMGYAPKWSGRGRRWRNADVVIVDDAHLLSSDQLDRMDQEAKAARTSKKPFGGAVLVLLLDRYMCGTKRFTIDRAEAYRTIPHTVKLASVFGVKRDTAKKLFAWRRGRLDLLPTPSQHPQGVVPCRLTTSCGAALMNSSVMQKMSPLMTRAYAALTESSLDDPDATTQAVSIIDSCFPYQTVLTLCTGARVVLLCDYDRGRGLVAGMKGTITSFTEAGLPMVFFENSKVEEIDRVSWSVPRHPAVHRLQIPLKLGWAVAYTDVPTNSLTHVTIDPIDFRPREMYSVLTRCTDLSTVCFTAPCPPPV